jgi:peptide/nickel transport system ATP-binding protein
MPITHQDIKHDSASVHHHHTHAPNSAHIKGHHLLQIENLSIGFNRYRETNKLLQSAKKTTTYVVENLNLSVHAGEVVGIVGASGAGKTLLADAIMGLFASNADVFGRIWFDGEEQSAETLTKLRGKGISLVPQSVSYLDPLMKVGDLVCGPAKNKAERALLQKKLFERYHLGEEVANLYPFELSGGMARRVLLCTALIDNPKLIIADEPTPGLDLELAKQALKDFRAFADKGGAVLLITHDIELALGVADRIAVFKDGRVVEETSVQNFASPDFLKHPFSKEIWYALPEHGFSAPPQSSPQTSPDNSSTPENRPPKPGVDPC